MFNVGYQVIEFRILGFTWIQDEEGSRRTRMTWKKEEDHGNGETKCIVHMEKKPYQVARVILWVRYTSLGFA
jgi:hypothetical protein